MTPQAIQQLQRSLGLPETGVLDADTMSAMTTAVTRAVSSNPLISTYAAGNTADAILGAYTSGDWSGVIDLTGKPFTDEQHKAVVTEAERVLGPAYREEEALDRSKVEESLGDVQRGFGEFQAGERRAFGQDKEALDQDSVNRGVLFSGSRVQKLNDLRTSYADRERFRREEAARTARTTARDYQYQYGGDAAKNLSDLYKLPTASSFDPNVAGGQVTPGKSISSVYDPSAFNFQGRKPVNQKANVQVRAAGSLANTANKLSLAGYGNKL